MLIKIQGDLVNLDNILYIDYAVNYNMTGKNIYYLRFNINEEKSLRYGTYNDVYEVKSLIDKIGEAVKHKVRYLEL